jgi:hypothetical protein
LNTLEVYKDFAAFEMRTDQPENPLPRKTSIAGLGSEAHPVILVIPKGILYIIFIDLLVTDKGSLEDPHLPTTVAELDISEKLAGLSLDSSVIHLEPEILEDSGISVGTGKYLFNREAVVRQKKFLDDAMMKERCQLAWISGAPGVGKSATTLACVSHLAFKNGYVVSWISCSIDITMFRLSGKTKTYYDVEDEVSLRKWLAEIKNRDHICVLDGDYTKKNALDVSLKWLRKKTVSSRRFLVVVSSVGGTTGHSDKIEDEFLIMSHHVPSWTLEEYCEALNDINIWNSVKNYIYKDVEEPVTLEKKRELIEKKFFFAGSSARYMLDRPLDVVKKRYLKAIETVTDLKAFMDGRIGILSSDAVHRLYSFDEEGKWSFVSKYVLQRLTRKMDVGMIDSFVDAYKDDLSPGAIGSMFEMRCHYCIRYGDVEFEVNGEKEVWKLAPVYNYDPKKPNMQLFEKNARFCLKPISFQQGGYDLIFVAFVKEDENTGQLIFKFDFIQITKASKHSLFLDFHNTSLTNIRTADTTNKIQMQVDVTFLSPKGRTVTIGDRRGDSRTIAWERDDPRRAEVSLPPYWS